MALEPTKGQKRASVWHVHVVKMPDETMDEDWLVVMTASFADR